MNTFRVALIASAALIAAACSTTPSKPAAPAPVAKAAAPAAATLAGNWVLTIESQMGSQDSKLTLNQNGKDLTGAIEAPPPVGNVQLTGETTGGDVKLSFNVNAQGMDIKIDLVGTQDSGKTMKGRAIFGSFGEGTFTAKRP